MIRFKNSAKKYQSLLLIFVLTASITFAGEYPKILKMYFGTTPLLDGYIGEDEYADAECFTGVSDWETATEPPCQSVSDLSVKAWIKHDGEFLYFAFDVTDDVLYGIDIDRWTHRNNLNPHTTDLSSWPWFGDGIELFMNSTYEWNSEDISRGDAKVWQLIFSSHKSTKDGLDKGGLIMGLPRNEYAWDNYREWEDNGYIQTAHRIKTKEEGRGYVVEWKIAANPCMQNNKGEFIDLSVETKVGINIEFQDLDEKEKGEGNMMNFHHIDYLAQVGSYSQADLRSFATLLLIPETRAATSDPE